MRNRDETEAVYAAYDDLFLFTIADGTVRRLTDTDTTERNPHFVLDEQSVAFERDQNLFIVELDTGAVRQVTNFRTGPDPDADPDQTQLQAYLERQQTELFEYVRKTERLEEERDERRDAERGFRVAAHYLKAGQRVSDLRLSQDGRFVTVILADRQEFQDGQVAEMPRYVTSSGFVEMRRLGGEGRGGGGGGRVKAGEPCEGRRAGLRLDAGRRARLFSVGAGRLLPSVCDRTRRRRADAADERTFRAGRSPAVEGGGLVRSGRLTGSRSQESEGRSQEEAGGLLQLISAGRRCPRPAKDRR